MKPAVFLALLFSFGFGLQASANDLRSPFASSIPGFPLQNAHVLHEGAGEGTVVRGGAPLEDTSLLRDRGFTHVLIFKNETSEEVRSEIAELMELGFAEDKILHVPFRWRGLPSFERACRQTVQALQFLRDAARTPGQKAYFHCTLGEDRTGYLAGLFEILTEGKSTRRAFYQDLCENGYENGNGHKPYKVTQAIRAEVTPLFLKMAYLIQTGALGVDSLDPAACDNDPGMRDEFRLDAKYQASRYYCRTSSKFPK